MAPFPLALLFSMGLLSSDVACVAIPVPIDKIMRTERSEEDEFMEISAAGAMQSSARRNVNASTPQAASALEDKPWRTNLCSIDYTLGKAGSCECELADTHHVILEEEKCRHAAQVAGITAPDDFLLAEERWNHHPRGCFKDKCRPHSNEQCYFYNPIGDLPAQCRTPPFIPAQPDGSEPEVHGVPVCERKKFEYGQPDGNHGCPNGYERELDESKCHAASVCLSKEYRGRDFIVTRHNQSQHDDFPVGCFLHQDNLMHYNPQLVNWLEPSHPIGTPLCKAAPPDLTKTGDTAEHVENRVNSTIAAPAVLATTKVQ